MNKTENNQIFLAGWLMLALILITGCDKAQVFAENDAAVTAFSQEHDYCEELAIKFGVEPEGDVVIENDEFGLFGKDFSCRLNSEGELKLFRVTSSDPFVVTDNFAKNEEIFEIARDFLEDTEYMLSENAELPVPETEMSSSREVAIYDEPRMYGYPTNGFAGSFTIIIDHHNRRVVGLMRSESRPVREPNVQITESESIQIAESWWEGKPQFGKETEVISVLQYFFPNAANITGDGKRFKNRGEVALCYDVRFVRRSEDGSVFPLGVVTIDAETGDILTK